MNTLPEQPVIIIESMNTLRVHVQSRLACVAMFNTRGMSEKKSKKIASYFLNLSDSMLMKARELIESKLYTGVYRIA